MEKDQGTTTIRHTVPKPTPPPTQMIREGVKPKVHRPAVQQKPQTDK